MEARATVGPRDKGGRPKKNSSRAENSFTDDLERLGLDKSRAQDAQRIGTLPEDEKTKAYAAAKADEILPTISMLIDVARPYWYKANRKHRHKAIAARAAEAADKAEEMLGPFPLIYADPPWRFDTFYDPDSRWAFRISRPSKSEMAEEALRANPGKSDRVVAREINISRNTVRNDKPRKQSQKEPQITQRGQNCSDRLLPTGAGYHGFMKGGQHG